MFSFIRKKIFRHTKKLVGAERALALSDKLFRSRNVLKKGPMFSIDVLVKINASSFFIHGCVVDKNLDLVSVGIESAPNRFEPLDDFLLWRSDKLLSRKFNTTNTEFKPLFTGLVSSKILNLNENNFLVLRLKTQQGECRKKIRLTHTESPPLTTIKKILETVPAESTDKRKLFDSIYGPAIKMLWNQRTKQVSQPEVIRFNNHLRPSTPEVSLVIPIYGRYDFMDYQLNLFSLDQDMRNHEIVYVIDDPSIAELVRASAERIEKIYKIAFTVVFLPENLGYAGSNNVGVSVAVGDNILLLNSDVMPASQGWLSKLLLSVEQVLAHSFVGVRLVYEDGTIQHDGMKYLASPFMNNLWTNTHPGKGLHMSLVVSDGQLVEREAVTGACVLMRKSVFNALGGFNEDYILGDYEDSDLCMKAVTTGIKIMHNSEIVLYHLERQSQSLVSEKRWKEELTYYNCWYHTQQWGKAITRLKAVGNE